MNAYALTSHIDRPPSAVRGVFVDLHRSKGGGANLNYRVIGAAELVMPACVPSERADGLWHSTCFELFLMFDDDERYVEFNFSPSTRWAAYAFRGYREGMSALELAEPLEIERQEDGVSVRMNLADLPYGALRMGLSAVIEELDGTTSYWALAHPPGAPDFHHPACFAATLPAPARG